MIPEQMSSPETYNTQNQNIVSTSDNQQVRSRNHSQQHLSARRCHSNLTSESLQQKCSKKLSSNKIFHNNDKKKGDLNKEKDTNVNVNLNVSGFSIENRSKTATIKELLSFLIAYLDQTVTAFKSPRHSLSKNIISSSGSGIGIGTGSGIWTGTGTGTGSGVDLNPLNKDSNITRSETNSLECTQCSWLVKQVRALSVLLELTRGFLLKSCDGDRLKKSGIEADLPFTPADANSLLRTLVRTADNFLQANGDQLTNLLLSKGTSIKENLESDPQYPVSMLLSTHERRSMDPLELIQEVQNNLKQSYFSTKKECDKKGNNNLKSEFIDEKLLGNAIGQLRQEIVLTYFLLQTDEQYISSEKELEIDIEKSKEIEFTEFECQSTINEIKLCLSTHFDILFFLDSQKTDFFLLFGNLLSYRTPKLFDKNEEKDSRVPKMKKCLTDSNILRPCKNSVEYIRVLGLFTRILSKYRTINDVIKLFTKSRRFYGLNVFQQLLSVTNNLSLRLLENKIHISPSLNHVEVDINISIPITEISKANIILEQCSTIFIKCAVPMVYQSTIKPLPSVRKVSLSPSSINSSTSILLKQNNVLNINEIQLKEDEIERRWVELGSEIIKNVFYHTEIILDLLAEYCLNDDVTYIFRYSTVIPTILPTILIFGISKSRSMGCIQELLPLTSSLIKKIQILIPFKDLESSPTKGGSCTFSRRSSSPKGILKTAESKEELLSMITHIRLSLDSKTNGSQPIIIDENEKNVANEKERMNEIKNINDIEKINDIEIQKVVEKEISNEKEKRKDGNISANISGPVSPSKKG